MEKLVIARMLGGLGNQLFVYAMARRLSLKNDVPLRLDIVSGFNEDCYRRKFLLNHFNIQADIADSYESFMDGLGPIRRRLWMKLAQLHKFENKPYIIEEKNCFDPRLLDLKINQKVYLQGYWQSERYFKDIEHIIRQDLEVISPHDAGASKIAEKIRNSNSISLHARSYHEVPQHNGAMTLSMDYYSKAVKIITQNVDNPHFFCFSDNLDWFKANLKFEFPVTFVSYSTQDEEARAVEDIWMMSQCKHHIIANSTFSWWGAWLNKSPEKIVIAPGGDWNNKDLIPKSWIIL